MPKAGPNRTAVLLDLDGTLLDTTYLHTLAWWRALDEAGVGRTMVDIHHLIGMGGSEMLTTLLGHDDEALSRSHGTYFAEMHGCIRPLPGARDLVRTISSRDTLVVIATSATEANLRALLDPLDCDGEIDAIVHGEMVDRAKPSPDIFTTALRQVGISPESAVAVGDAVWDVKAATGAGIGCIGVESGGICREMLADAGALEVYGSCAELLEELPASPLARVLAR